MKTRRNTRTIQTLLVLTFLSTVWAVTLGLGDTALASQMSGADTYIGMASGRLKAGTYQGHNSRRQACTVDVKLERHGKARRYQVEIQPTLILENASSAPTTVTFNSTDARVLFDDQIVRAVANAGEDYMILAIENLKGGQTRIRGYNEKNRGIRSSDCTITL